ncbi:MAG: NAD(P)H-quinone oxidoreductase [Pyrinomonadaceae bacterium]|nr:NAD(P)H-quinone oxidoreductase [Pyrinomonadaceae bacterium]
MKVVWIKEFGGAENLEIREFDDLQKPANNRVLVKVHAAALNRADLLQRKGLYPAPKSVSSHILGLEFAGEVAEIGGEVQNFRIGQRVFGITAGAAQAEFVAIDENQLVEIPANLDYIEAAAVPEAFITAHDAIFTQGELKSGETLLIHAVGSGVGLAALQLAKAVNATVFGTSRTSDKLEKCREFGLDEAILTDDKTDFARIVNEKSNGANVILDLVGAKYLNANLLSLTQFGRLIFVGTTAGSKAELDISIVMRKRLRLFGTVLRSRVAEEKAMATKLFAAQVVPLLAKGIVKPNVDKVFEFEEVQKAHEYLESNQSFGKVVLRIAD